MNDCEHDEINHTLCTENTYLVTCWPTLNMPATAEKRLTLEVYGGSTATIITLPRREEKYSCSVQARNMCQLLSNDSTFVDIYITGIYSNNMTACVCL